MAHYAVLNENNIVTQVFVGKDENDPLPEGYTSWENYYGAKRTSYNTRCNEHIAGGTPFRGNYAGVGFIYDPDLDAFIPPKPYSTWKFDYDLLTWVPPVPKPDAGEDFGWRWSELNQDWYKVYKPVP